MDIFSIILPVVVVGAPLLAISYAKFSLDGGWHQRFTHKCGYHERIIGRIRNKVCPRCAENLTPENCEIWAARARFPIGWEWKERRLYTCLDQ